jgi:hypothetical protein
VLSGLDFVRVEVEVEVQKIFQDLRVAKKNNSTYVYLGLGGSARARRFDVHTTAEGTEARQIWLTTKREFVRSFYLITVNGHVVESEKMINAYGQKQDAKETPESMDARRAHSDGTS